jgi:transmembrane sensor
MSAKRASEIEQAASEWLVRRTSGSWTPADQAALDAWLEGSTLRRVAYLRLELAWEKAARLKALGAGVPGLECPPRDHWNLTPFFEPRETPTPQSMSSRWRKLRFAAAATLLLALAAGLGMALLERDPRYTTAVGHIESVNVADGSKVTLNSATRLRISLTRAERHVELSYGEAFFQVSKDPHRPFVVQAGSRRIVAVGTQFSVRRDGDEVQVVVTEGQVRLEGDGVDVLTPGAVARAGEAGVLVQRKTLAEARDALSWRDGMLRFRDQSLSEAVAEFNRYNKRQIVIRDPSVGLLKIEGNFRTTNVDAFVRLLESGLPVRAEFEGENIVLTSN